MLGAGGGGGGSHRDGGHVFVPVSFPLMSSTGLSQQVPIVVVSHCFVPRACSIQTYYKCIGKRLLLFFQRKGNAAKSGNPKHFFLIEKKEEKKKEKRKKEKKDETTKHRYDGGR